MASLLSKWSMMMVIKYQMLMVDQEWRILMTHSLEVDYELTDLACLKDQIE